MRYAVEKLANKEYARFHFDTKLPAISEFSQKQEAGSLSLKYELLAIPGVIGVHCYESRLSIQRGGTYLWEEIIDKVVAVVRREMKIHEEMEQVAAFRD